MLWPPMQLLKRLREKSIRFVQQVRTLSRSAARAVKPWRRQAILDEAEAERLDRIRNPSKYLGKS
jgi:hypothetical protein